MFAALTTLAADYTYTAPTTNTNSAGDAAAAATFVMFILLVSLPFLILRLVGFWKMLTKAGRPGWASLVPGYNLLQIIWMTGRPWYWILLLMVPFVNIVVGIMIYNDLSKSFGRGVGTTLLFLFVPVIGYPVVGLGSAQYLGPVFQNTAAAGASPDAGTGATPTATPPAASDSGDTPQPPTKPAV